MLLSGHAHTVAPGEGRTVNLGVIQMRFLAAGEATDRAFTLADVTGGPGPWTVPHIHRETQESFFVLEGEFTAGAEGGRFLTLMVPGGLEEMFIELADLPPDSITDLTVRAAISARHDSTPA